MYVSLKLLTSSAPDWHVLFYFIPNDWDYSLDGGSLTGLSNLPFMNIKIICNFLPSQMML